MANIRVDLDYTIKDGSSVVFRSPCDCTEITGLIAYYIGADGNQTSKEFLLADAHGENVGDIPHLFASDVVVKVILDVTSGMAFVQNADTNAYLEGRFAEMLPKKELNAAVNDALAQAKASGEFDGKTPVKGVDYFTDADKEEMVQYLMDVLKTPVFGRVDADNNIILSGDLTEGTYTFKYEDSEGNLTVIGTLGSSGEDEPVIINQIPISVGKDGAVYNGKGYKENTRYSASSGEEKTADGVYLSGYIPIYAGAVVRLKNVRMNKNDTALYVCQLVYAGNLTENGSSQNMNNTEETTTQAFSPVWDADGNLVQITIPDWGVQYIRLVTAYIGNDSIVTVDQEIPE